MANGSNHWGKLMAEAQGGSESSYSQLLSEIYPVIKRFLVSRLGVFGLEDDVVQECIMAIHKSRHTYDLSRPFQSWMFSVVKYKSIDLLRKKQKQWEREVLDDDVVATYSAPDSKTLVEEEQQEWIDQALTALPDEMRRAVQLTKIDGLNTKEASTKEGITPVALRSRVSRAYKLMRKHLEKSSVS